MAACTVALQFIDGQLSYVARPNVKPGDHLLSGDLRVDGPKDALALYRLPTRSHRSVYRDLVRTRIRIGERALPVRLLLQFFLGAIELRHLLAQLLDLLRQPLGLGLELQRLRAVGVSRASRLRWVLCSICRCRALNLPGVKLTALNLLPSVAAMA
jgi:hypothetical protein